MIPPWNERRDARQENLATCAARDHLLCRELRKPERCREIDLQNIRPVLFGIFNGRPAADHPGIIDQDVYSSEARDRLVEQSAGRARVGQICDRRASFAPAGLDSCSCAVRGCRISVANDGGSSLRERYGNCSPKPA